MILSSVICILHAPKKAVNIFMDDFLYPCHIFMDDFLCFRHDFKDDFYFFVSISCGSIRFILFMAL